MTLPIVSQPQFVIPTNYVTSSVVHVIQSNESAYQGDAALALTHDALWMCTPYQTYEIIHLQSMREISVQDFRGMSFEKSYGNQRVYVNPLNAWGVVITHQRLGNFVYTFSFLTYFFSNANDWQRRLQQTIAQYDEALYRGMLAAPR
jgi:hypothetical protein